MAQRVTEAGPALGGRVVLYRRVSAIMGRAGEEFISPEMQEANMRGRFGARGLRVVAVIDDMDVSGRTFDREGVEAIRAMAEARQMDYVGINELNRLGRNAGEALMFIAELRSHGVEILSTKENVEDRSATGKLNTGIALLIAEMYSDQIAEKWKETIEHRARSGKPHGPPPIGYRREVDMNAEPGRFGRRPSRITVDPILGPIMTDVFRGYADGHPIDHLRQRLAIRGKPPGLTHLRRLLAHPFYIGKVVLWQGDRNDAPRSADEAAVVVQGTHKPLTDEATFRRVRRRLKADAKTIERRHLHMGWSLAGLATCDHCETALSIKTNTPYTKLVCRSSKRVSPTDCAGCGNPRLDELEAATLDELTTQAARLRATPSLLDQRRAHGIAVETQRQALERDLADNLAAQTKLVAGWSAGKVPDHAYETNLAEFAAAENAISDRLADLGDEDPPVEPSVAARLAEQVVAVWPDHDDTERRVLLASVIRRVRVRRAAHPKEPRPPNVSRWISAGEARADIEFRTGVRKLKRPWPGAVDRLWWFAAPGPSPQGFAEPAE